jgi:hypothetical protein
MREQLNQHPDLAQLQSSTDDIMFIFTLKIESEKYYRTWAEYSLIFLALQQVYFSVKPRLNNA